MNPPDNVILTPNQRLARTAREKYDAEMIAQKISAFTSVQVYPLQSFIVHIWENLIKLRLITPKYFLTSFERELIWHKIIADDIYHKENKATKSESLAALALKSWQLLSQWQIDILDPAFLRTEELKSFQRWAANYQQWLLKKHWIDHEEIFKEVTDFLEKNLFLSPPPSPPPSSSSFSFSWIFFLPKNITLLGFTDFSPQEKKFLDCLKKYSVKIKHDNYSQTPKSILKTCFPNSDAEINAIAQWAYQKNLQKPDQTIACIFPQLEANQNKIIACFQRYFTHEKYTKLINVSLGKPLLKYSLIHSAFVSLELLQDKFPAKNLSEFLLSPYIHFLHLSVSEKALLDKKLKCYLPIEVHKKSLLSLEKFKFLTFLNKNFPSFLIKTPQEWTDVFQAHLKFLGFPGKSALSSEEYQLMNHFELLIENFGRLTLVLGKINLDAALYYFKKLAEKSIFQPQRSPHVKIEILGMMEAAGLTFDHVWIAGLTENAWPLETKPNPFFPISTVKENENFYAKMTDQLFLSGQKIILSYADIEKDIVLYPSKILYAVKKMSQRQLDKWLNLKIYKIAEKNIHSFVPIILEREQDAQAPKVDLQAIQPQGSELLKDQAACPFRAFVKHRLGAKEIELSQLGFKAMTKGNMAHKILEKFFSQIAHHQVLSDMPETEAVLLIQQITQKIVDENTGKFDQAIFSLTEKKRLEKLISAWITIEKSRESFSVIACEEKIETHLGALPLHLRIDRIDKIGDNRYLIIDYKTGSQDIKPDAYDEPQLPLYSISASHLAIESIALAYIRPYSKEMKFKEFKNISSQKIEWHNVLTQLAQEYLSGHAKVEPRYGDETCRYCDLSSICRIKATKQNLSSDSLENEI